jgi:hypothetical protein
MDRFRPSSQAGFTVVEVLVAAVVLLVGVLSSFLAIEASQHLDTVAERQTELAHRAQAELERVKSLPYDQVGLTGTNVSWSGSVGSPTYVSAPAGSCPDTTTGPAPTYQPDHYPGGSASIESMVVNGCSYAGTTYSTGTVEAESSWSDGNLSGRLYDFITWTSDPTCSQTTTPGSVCPVSNDYKRIVVVASADGVAQPSQPAIVGGYATNPSAAPPSVTNTSDPLHNPSTLCIDGQGHVVSCSNTLVGTPLQYFPTDCPYNGSCVSGGGGSATTPPACAGNPLHATLVASGQTPPAPDILSPTLPAGQCLDSGGNPLPPCYATDLSCGGLGGLPLRPSGSNACGSPPADNTRGHSWVTPDIPAGTSVNLTGTGSMTSYLQSTTGATVSGTLCLGLYIVRDSTLGSQSGNLFATPIGSTATASVTAPASAPAPISFTFTTGQGATVSSSTGNLARIEFVEWLAGTGSTQMTLDFDQLDFPSQVTLMSS